MKSLTNTLPYFGAMPFVACALLLLMAVYQLPFFGEVSTLMMLYGLVIATFMAGVHWGTHLYAPQKWTSLLCVSSNLLAVMLWLLVATSEAMRLIYSGLILCFIALLIIDVILYRSALLKQDYFRTRIIVTFIVVMSLFVAILAI